MNLRGRNKVDPTFNMSSMTDIVFLLLIFFMITSTLVTVSAIDVLLPNAIGKTENSKSVAVTITNTSLFYIDKTKVTAANLETEILRKVGTNKQKTIVIRGDKEVPYKNVMRVIDTVSYTHLTLPTN